MGGRGSASGMASGSNGGSKSGMACQPQHFQFQCYMI